MKLYIILGIVLCSVFAGCSDGGIQWVTKGQKIDMANTTPTINQTNITIEQPKEIDLSDGVTYFISKGSIIVTSKNTTIIIDAGDNAGIEIAKKYNLSVNLLFLSTDKPEKTAKAKYYVLSTRPDAVMDNGIPSANRNDYSYYLSKYNNSINTISHSRNMVYQDINAEFFVPYEEKGFNIANHDFDSIASKINNLLYMSDCYGECEKTVDAKCTYLVLANNGYCPTNSLDFILGTEAEYIIGEALCPSILSELGITNMQELKQITGIEFKKIEGTLGIQDERSN